MKKNCCIFLLTCFSFFVVNCSFAQDSSHLRISLLTCTPGDELYSIFGHSAFRVIDSSSVNDDRDIVYNYGTFNFDDEGFYLKFARGKLLYYVSIVKFEDFKYMYQATNRGITEQVLNLTAAEKINVRHFLITNLKEENKYYKYDFFSSFKLVIKKCRTFIFSAAVKFNTCYVIPLLVAWYMYLKSSNFTIET